MGRSENVFLVKGSKAGISTRGKGGGGNIMNEW